MTKPVDAIKKVIDELLAPRFAAAENVMAVRVADPLPVTRTDLLYVWDEYGNQYLDFAALMQPVGHRHQIMLGVISDHQRHYHFTAPQSQHLLRWPVSYAEELSRSLTGPGQARKRVLFCEGEREAVQLAVRLACHRTDRPTVAVLDTGWHDWLDDRRLMFPGDPDRLDIGVHGALLLAGVDTAAAPMPVAAWVAAARAKDIPVILDESITGFGRLGRLWGQHALGVDPDLTVLGGPVGGSLPLGAVIAEAGYFSTPEMCDTSSQAGHPLCCAAGSATLLAVGLGVCEHVSATAEVFSTALDELCAQFPEHVEGHHGSGFLRGLRLRRRATDFHRRARSHGLLVAPTNGHTVLLAPPLVASDLEVKRGVDLLADTLMSWDDESLP